MRDEKFHRARVERCVAELQKEFDLGWITIINKYDTVTDGERICCETTCDPEYRQNSLKWNLTMVALSTDEELTAVVIHEFVHVLIACLWDFLPAKIKNDFSRLNEMAVENVTRAIVAGRDKARKKA